MKKILIANRGEIARRVIVTAHRMGLETVAVYSDADAAAPHVREATHAFALGGTAPVENYLRVDKLLAAAQASGADAVHPGYGFLSEDARFAQAVLDAGLTWIGPPPDTARALGDKGRAKAMAARQGVPCLPGYAGEDQSDKRFIVEAEKIGFPLMVKAVAGGGGRGMRLVTEAGQLLAAVESARSEARAGFGNGDLLIERAVMNPRHVEVQIFADTHGNVVHMGERDCSVQRRHQKIIEETPSPAVSAELRERMGECAIALARGAGYVSAGTVEFLLEGDAFYFMEMNTRLQVEHPVTEAVTGLDLVEWQIRVARGEALPLAQEQIRFHGHAIEVRLCAEDENYVPHAGCIRHFRVAFAVTHFEHGPLRLDSFIEAGAEITSYYDAMLGKLIVHQSTRAGAIKTMLAALRQVEVLGLPTNRGFLIECLSDESFRKGAALISFLRCHADKMRERLRAKERAAHNRHAAAVLYAGGAGALPCPLPSLVHLRHRGEIAPLVVRTTADGIEILGHPTRDIGLTHLADGTVICREGEWVDTAIRAISVPSHDPTVRWHAQTDGVDWWFEDVSFESTVRNADGGAATELTAPFSGKVAYVAAKAGQKLKKGERAVVLESMKLEHNLAPQSDVTVLKVMVSVGQQVAPGTILVQLSPEEHSTT